MKNITQIFLSFAIALSTFPAVTVYSADRPVSVTVANDNDLSEEQIAAARAKLPPDPPEDPELNARKLFTRYMSIEVTRQLYKEAQWNLLATPEDTAYTHYFFALNDQLGGLFDKVKELHDLQLQEAVDQFRIGKVPLAKGYTPYVNRVLKTGQSAAEAIGLPQQAIDNIEVFSENGPMNAFTISGNSNRLIIALMTDIMKLSMGELKGVLGHELGHIRLLHSVKGIMHNILMTVIMKSYAAKQFTDNLDSDSNLGLFPAKVCEHGIAGHVHEQPAIRKGVAMSSVDQKMGLVINGAIQAISNLPPNVRDQVIKPYVALLMKTLIAEDGPDEAKQILLEVYKLPATFATEINGDKLLFALMQSQAAISRGQETSADHISTSVVSNEYLANAMVHLAGPPTDPSITDPVKKREELDRLRQMIVDEMAKTNKASEGQNRSGAIGLATHPPIGIRIDKILKIETFPEILFADPVLRLYLLEDQLQTAAVQGRPDAKEKLALLRRDLLVLIDARGLLKKFNLRFDKAVQYAAFNRAANLKAIALLESAPVMTDKLKEGIGFLKKETDNALEFTRLLSKHLDTVKATTPEEKAILAARKKMVADLLASTTPAEAVAAQIAARPVNANNPVTARRLLPVEDQQIPNIDRSQLCMALLGQAAQAAKSAKAAKPTPPPHPPTAP